VAVAAIAAVVLVVLAVVHPPGAGATQQLPTQTTRTTRHSSSTTTSTTAATATTPTTDVTLTTAVPPGQIAPNGGPLLVPGASDAPASKANDVKQSDNTGTVVALVIAGLLVVALLLGVLTYWYWRNTRPMKPTAGDGAVESESGTPAHTHRATDKSGNEREPTKSTSDEPAGAT
jgi:hypothetical protein